MRKQEGNIGDIMMTGFGVLALTVLMTAYIGSVELIQRKMEVGQLARKYILRMETVGYLTESDCTMLEGELTDLGVTDIDLTGTTVGAVSFGEPVCLEIRGKLKGEYAFEEQRVSTAKN